MPKLMDNIKQNWKHVVVALAAITALAVSLSGNSLAKNACNANPQCAAAYAAGEDVTPTVVVSPTAE